MPLAGKSFSIEIYWCAMQFFSHTWALILKMNLECSHTWFLKVASSKPRPLQTSAFVCHQHPSGDSPSPLSVPESTRSTR